MAQLPTDNGVMAHTEHIRKKRNTAFFCDIPLSCFVGTIGLEPMTSAM